MISEDMILCFIDQSGKCNYHLGAAYMIANLWKFGYSASLYVNYQSGKLDQIVDDIVSRNVKCVGFTLYDTNYFLVRELCKKIKEKMKDIFVFFGGATVSFCYEKILKDSTDCDGCIIFEGEESAIEIMQYLEGKISKSEIKNFVYLNEAGEIIKNKSRDISKDLDEFPSPYLTGAIDAINYYRNHKNSWHRMVQIISSRGCVYSCKYCSNAVLGHNIIRFHSIDRVIEEMKFLKKVFEKNNIKPRIQFMDDIFTFNKTRTLEFCKLVIEENVGLEFAIQTRPDCIDKEQIEMLAKAGCCAINFGLENTNQDVLYSMGKCSRYDNNEISRKEKDYIEATKQAVKCANENKIYTAVNMISGWENQSYHSYLKDIEFLDKLGADYSNTASLIHYPGTDIYQPAVDKVLTKMKYIEDNCGLIFSLTYNFFPELYPFEHNLIKNTERESSQYFRVRRKAIIQAVMGIRNSSKLKSIIYEDTYPNYEWLKENANSTTNVIFFRNSEINYWYFSSYAYAYDYKIKKIIKEFNESQYGDTTNKDMLMYIDDRVELSLINLDDADDAEDFFHGLEDKSIEVITSMFSVTKSNKIINNYCRWCSSEDKCPAKNLSRLVVKDDGIYTCNRGVKICDIEKIMDWDKVERSINKMIEESEAQRGCSQCEVKDTCSKCLSLGNMSPERYCEIQRKRPYRKNKLVYDIKKVENFSE